VRTAILIVLAALMSTTNAGQSYEQRKFVVEVVSDAPGSEQNFRGAIGYGGQLQLIESTTPFRKELNAVSLTAMFEATAADGRIAAALYEDEDGKLNKLGDVRGRRREDH